MEGFLSLLGQDHWTGDPLATRDVVLHPATASAINRAPMGQSVRPTSLGCIAGAPEALLPHRTAHEISLSLKNLMRNEMMIWETEKTFGLFLGVVRRTWGPDLLMPLNCF